VNISDALHVSTARCNGQIRELVIGRLNQEIAGKLVESVNILRESYIGIEYRKKVCNLYIAYIMLYSTTPMVIILPS